MTNGIVVCIENGKVVLKLVVGCDGHIVTGIHLANSLRVRRITAVDAAYAFACKYYRYGCTECRVCVSATEIRYDGEEEVPHIYRDTFDEITANPRYSLPSAGPMTVVVSDYDNGVTYIQDPRDGRQSASEWLNENSEA